MNLESGLGPQALQPNSTSTSVKLGWSQEQACLADAFVTFMSAVAQHRCKAVHGGKRSQASSENVPVQPPTLPPAAPTDETSSDRNAEGEEAVSSSTNSPGGFIAVAPPVGGYAPLTPDTPHCEWYQLVIASILTLLQHEHPAEQVNFDFFCDFWVFEIILLTLKADMLN